MNKITKEEIQNVYRIEYMPSSNWDMGLNRRIWVLEINEDGEVDRSIYIGDPLVPEYSAFNEESDEEKQEEFSNKLKEGCLLFRNSFEGYEIIDSLESFGIENWNFYNHGPTIDGPNYDFAFFTKDKEGNGKIYRYQFMESSLEDKYIDFFHKLFDVVYINEFEIVTINEEMTRQSNKKLPGNYIQN